METFNYIPNTGAQVDYQPRVTVLRFGDGYEQRLSHGLNINPEAWLLEFRGLSTAQADAINAFFCRHQSVDAFRWKSPSNTDSQVVCRQWSMHHEQPDFITIQARFEQVFDLD